jgi:hypothetical protein
MIPKIKKHRISPKNIELDFLYFLLLITKNNAQFKTVLQIHFASFSVLETKETIEIDSLT